MQYTLLRSAINHIWKFINEWQILGSVVGILLIKYSYIIIQYTFPNIPWDQRLNPGVDSLIYFIQAVAIYYMALGVVWREHKTDMPKLAAYFQDKLFEDEDKEPFAWYIPALLIPAFKLIIFTLICIAVFP